MSKGGSNILKTSRLAGIAVLFTITAVLGLDDANATTTFGSYEKVLSDKHYPFGYGILEYKELDGGPCMYNIPNYAITSVDSAEQTRLNTDEFQHTFFAVIGNYDDSSYQYLQIELPSGSGYPFYLLDLRNDTQKIRGEFYQDYENMAVLIESDMERNLLSEDSYKRFFTENSKDVTHNGFTFEPGNYNFGAILLKSPKPYWINGEECVLRVDWPFTINQEGRAIVDEPIINTGKLFEVTEEFPPLKQHNAGVFAIDCKPGLRLIFNTSNDSGDKVPACVTIDTQKKLIERGWGQLK